MSPALTNRGHSDRPSVITNQRRLSHHRGGTGTAMGIEKGVWPEAELTARPDPAAGAPAPSEAPRAATVAGTAASPEVPWEARRAGEPPRSAAEGEPPAASTVRASVSGGRRGQGQSPRRSPR